MSPRAMDPAVDGDWARIALGERVALSDLDVVFTSASDPGEGTRLVGPLSCLGGPMDTRYFLGRAGTGVEVTVQDVSSAGLPPCQSDGWTRVVLATLARNAETDGPPTLVVFRSRAATDEDSLDSVDLAR